MNCKNCNNLVPENAKFCNKCGKSIETKTDSSIEYFSISPKRLALFSVLTLGIYEIYWFYKNWEAVKKAENLKISPLGRAIFAVFYCNSLFKKVLESAKTHNYQKSYSPGWLATAYILLLIVGNGLSRVESTDVGFNLIWLIIAISSFIPLLSVQKAINFNNEKIKGSSNLKSGFSSGEVVLIIIGLIWFLLVLWGSFIPAEPEYNSNSYNSTQTTNNNYSKADLINETVREIKAEMTLPNQLDEVTKLVDISAQTDAIRYHYVLTDVDTSSLSNAYLKNFLVSDICGNADTKSLLVDHGINMEYSYTVNTGERYFVTFTKADCY
ncbi:MAG: zinc ribbon domain-containing protein [Candidatus Shapirobacteria bacterium]|nr:zinc ribbon domain-containing protein [Candidatus Shapirobacteria bacterium]